MPRTRLLTGLGSFGLIAGLLLLGLPALGSAQEEDVHMIVGEPLPAESLADMLYPETRPLTRSIVLHEEPTDPPVVGFVVQFGFDSTEIRPAAHPYLDEVGRMLNLERVSLKRLHIEGHTDSSGPAQYNQRLSERRAQSVANYLVQSHGVDPERLVTGGKGEGEPLKDRNPRDPLNRRVQFQSTD